MSGDIDVLIIGGGISGLSVAGWLAREGVSAEVWEWETNPGGKIRSSQTGGYLTESAASMVMNFRPEVNRLLNFSGLLNAKTLRSSVAENGRYVVHNRRLALLSMRLGELIFSPLWSLRGKLRLLAEPFIPKGGSEEESVSRFISRRLGKEFLENAMEPFVAGVLASDPDLANASQVLPRLAVLERRYGSLTLGVFLHKILRRRTAVVSEVFSFANGMADLTETLAKTPGLHFHGGLSVSELAPATTSRGWRVTATSSRGERTVHARQVVLSTPADTAANLLAPLDSELSTLLHGIQYAPLSVVHLGFDKSAVRHPLDGAGFLVPRREHLALSGNLWMSTLFPGRAPQGKVLLSSYLGGARLAHAAAWDDERSAAKVMSDLKPLLGIRSSPEMVRIDRHERALPLYHGAYHGRLREIEKHLQQLPGLHLAANYRGGVSVRDRICCAHALTARILQERKAATVQPVSRNSAMAQALPESL
ncbi:MAG: protoporphyrinogen oxidase [Gammaproteobacteria bacterium]|nr:protoporphyrinogen oxidase [Gammaproteobacteria bacterium]